MDTNLALHSANHWMLSNLPQRPFGGVLPATTMAHIAVGMSFHPLFEDRVSDFGQWETLHHSTVFLPAVLTAYDRLSAFGGLGVMDYEIAEGIGHAYFDWLVTTDHPEATPPAAWVREQLTRLISEYLTSAKVDMELPALADFWTQLDATLKAVCSDQLNSRRE